jgi:hypothetical protein
MPKIICTFQVIITLYVLKTPRKRELVTDKDNDTQRQFQKQEKIIQLERMFYASE